jgi:hypothetical protein
MNGNVFSRLLALLRRLDEAKISYQLKRSRDDALMVLAYAPGEYWEIEFLEDESVDVERYRSDGDIEDESILDELFALWAEPDASTNAATNHAGAPARP